FFLGHIHDVHTGIMEAHFGEEPGSYKRVRPAPGELRRLWSVEQEHVHFSGLQSELSVFSNFREAYACFMHDLTRQAVRSVKLVITETDRIKRLYVTGGFAKNPFFTGFLSLAFPGYTLFTSEVANATSLGAALVIAGKVWPGFSPFRELGLTEVIV
ncbi:MAG: hypothetical protein R6W31_12220, partial [Bacteroidales bacterium]